MMASSSSSNLSDHLLQDDLPWPSLPFVPTLHHTIGANHQWSQPLMLNCSDHFTSDELEVLLTAQGHHHSQSTAPTFPQLSSVLMMQELGFQWSNRAVADASMTMLISQQDSHKIKAGEELPAESLNSPRSSCGTTIAYNDIADGAGLPLAALDGVVLPSVNVSRLQKPCPAAPPLPGDVFEILASARLCKTLLSQASSVLHNGMPLLREHVPYGPPDLLQGPSIDNYKMGVALASGDNAAEGRRGGGGGGHGSTAEHKAAACQHGALLLVPSSSSSKKPRLESRSSTIVPSFKVRKEKLGDRIAALQQLVSPFGKTDTASVLMEAIGYIKFLQDQVETLSGPYMRSSKNKKARRTQQRGSSANGGENKEEGANNKLDLRSRGLCLVPLSCTSYVTNENGVWAPPPNFRGN